MRRVPPGGPSEIRSGDLRYRRQARYATPRQDKVSTSIDNFAIYLFLILLYFTLRTWRELEITRIDKQKRIRPVLRGTFLTPGSGMGKKSGSGSGMNKSYHISES
jgi:hypothetical protein